MVKEKLKHDLEKIVKICKHYGVEKVILFGSCVDDIDSAMDIDIAVSGIQPESFFTCYGEIIMNVSNNVDFIDIQDVREHFRRKVIEKGQLLYAK